MKRNKEQLLFLKTLSFQTLKVIINDLLCLLDETKDEKMRKFLKLQVDLPMAVYIKSNAQSREAKEYLDYAVKNDITVDMTNILF